MAPRPLHHVPAQHCPFPSSLHTIECVRSLCTSSPPRTPCSALPDLFSFSPRPRMLQLSLPLPGFPPLLPCLLCSVQGLRQTVPNSFFLSLSFLHLGRAPCSGHRPVRLSKAWDWGPLSGSLENAGMQECKSCRSRKSV